MVDHSSEKELNREERRAEILMSIICSFIKYCRVLNEHQVLLQMPRICYHRKNSHSPLTELSFLEGEGMSYTHKKNGLGLSRRQSETRERKCLKLFFRGG